ncbi:MAG: orotate phosphoribosyltransferase [Planctomycetota bacterium]|nr:orotate phosphoribosyltransferase [Planctomycetota bacterium]
MANENPAVLKDFREAGALLEGHFLLTSGLHSPKYLQCAQVMQNPALAERLCAQLARALDANRIECVVGPAIGGILVAYELARALGVRTIYAERQDGKMTLRRGFAVRPGERILLCEDVVTTGGSLLEVRDLVTAAGGQVVAVASLVDRTSGRDAGLGLRLTSLLKIDVPAYPAEECPMCRAGQPLVSPGRTGKKP